MTDIADNLLPRHFRNDEPSAISYSFLLLHGQMKINYVKKTSL